MWDVHILPARPDPCRARLGLIIRTPSSPASILFLNSLKFIETVQNGSWPRKPQRQSASNVLGPEQAGLPTERRFPYNRLAHSRETERRQHQSFPSPL